MNELKGNFKAAYDVVKRAERCVLLRSKAANPSHTYAVGDVDSNGLVFGLVLKTDPEAAVREFRTRSFPSWSPWKISKSWHAPKSMEYRSRNGPVGRLPGPAARH